MSIPAELHEAFDQDDFVVRIMAADYQTQTASSTNFRLMEDTQLVIGDPDEGLYAYTHYFTLYDLSARGFVSRACSPSVRPCVWGSPPAPVSVVARPPL